jgi:hypothetical protein
MRVSYGRRYYVRSACMPDLLEIVGYNSITTVCAPAALMATHGGRLAIKEICLNKENKNPLSREYDSKSYLDTMHYCIPN